YLLTKPHISAQDIVKHLHVSFPSAQNLIDHFVEINILKEITGKKRDRRYSYWQYLDLLAEGTKS
ncbi:MAG: Fic family protein, partial [Parachlamydiaceae bacterium]